MRVELVTFPTLVKLYGPPDVVDCPTEYPLTFHPNTPIEALHDKDTCPLPAEAETIGEEAVGKYKNPLPRVKEVPDEDVPIES